MSNSKELLKKKLNAENFAKLSAVENQKMYDFLADAIKLANPDSVFVCTDTEEDITYLRQQSVKLGEEKTLAMAGHTYHFDGYNDQARDKARTKYLLDADSKLGKNLNSIEKSEGTAEVQGFLKNSMADREMLICFWCLGPTDSKFSIPCVQITDSAYVAHSESILYRPGYEQFKKIGNSPDFFRFIHTAGELENNVSKNTDKRRVYIDLDDNIVYSTNTQYAGNTVGLKKLALRLAIHRTKVLELEQKHRMGYASKPVAKREFDVWAKEQKWGT